MDQWSRIDRLNGEVIVVGDLNLDKLKWQYPDKVNVLMVLEMKNTVESNGYAQMVTGPTRFWRNTAPSLVDHVWLNHPDRLLSCRNLSRPVADHNLVSTTYRTKGKCSVTKEIFKRQWRKLDLQAFKDNLAKVGLI